MGRLMRMSHGVAPGEEFRSAATTTRRRAPWWVFGSLVGGGIIAAPDSGERLFSISDLHGPSAIDAVGAVIAIGAWLPLGALLPRLWRRAPRPLARMTAALAAVGVAGLAVTVVGDLGWAWVVPVAGIVLAQGLLVADGVRSGTARRAT